MAFYLGKKIKVLIYKVFVYRAEKINNRVWNVQKFVSRWSIMRINDFFTDKYIFRSRYLFIILSLTKDTRITEMFSAIRA